MSNFLSGMFNRFAPSAGKALPFLSNMFNRASPYLANFAAGAAPGIGQAIGNRFGNAQLGNQIGQMAGQGIQALGGNQGFDQAGANLGQMAGQMFQQYGPRMPQMAQNAMNQFGGTPMNQLGARVGGYGGEQLDQRFGGMIPQQFQNSTFNTLGSDIGEYAGSKLPQWMQRLGAGAALRGLGGMAQQGIASRMGQYGMPQELQNVPFNQFGGALGRYAGQQADRFAGQYMPQSAGMTPLSGLPRAAGGYLGGMVGNRFGRQSSPMYDVQGLEEMPGYGMGNDYSAMYA